MSISTKRANELKRVALERLAEVIDKSAWRYSGEGSGAASDPEVFFIDHYVRSEARRLRKRSEKIRP
jgi:hypothetical protein